MILKGIIDTDTINYKKISMVLEFPFCDFKCDKECGQQVCQNCALATAPSIDVRPNYIVNKYINNPLTEAIVCQGLEPFDTWESLATIIGYIRTASQDDIVIYTGYNIDEIFDKVTKLQTHYKNIIIKFGRYIPGQEPHYDEVLGVKLASNNQYAKRIS